MTTRSGHSTYRSLAVGLALFGLFFQLFLPISLAAAAEPGAPNSFLEICSADGIIHVPLPDTGQTGRDGADDAYVEACNHCVLHAAHFVLSSRVQETKEPYTAKGQPIGLALSDGNHGPAPRAGFDARGPPRAAPNGATA